MQGRTSSLLCLDISRGSGGLLRGTSSMSVGAKHGQCGSVRNELVALMFRHLEEERQCLMVRLSSSVGIKRD